jgi:DNA repair protein RecO (recombination protein O)
MTSRQTPAIIIGIRDYGEADKVVTFLTPAQGRVTGIAKYAKKSKKRFANCLEPLNRVEFFLSPQSRGELEFIQKGELVNSFPSLRRDLKRLGAAAVLAELAGLMAAPPEMVGEVFQTLEGVLGLLENGGPPDSLLPAFLLRLLSLGGYGPRLQACLKCSQEPKAPLYFSVPQGGVVCGPCSRAAAGPLLPLSPGAWKLLRMAQGMELEKLPRLRFPRRQRDESLAVFRAFLRRHLGKPMKSWAFWDKVAMAKEGN